MYNLKIEGKVQYAFLDILFCVFIALQFVCDILVMRIVNIGEVSFTASSAIFCINFALMDIIANVYGMQAAKKISFINFGCQLLTAGLLYSFLAKFNPSVTNQDMYQNALTVRDFGLLITRNMILIPLAVLVGNLSNSTLMTLSKYIFSGRFIALRSLLCSFLGAFLMLGISYTKIFWNLGFSTIVKLIISSMIIKVIGAIILMLPTKYLSNFFKNYEGVDVYDLNLKFLQKRYERIVKNSGRVEA